MCKHQHLYLSYNFLLYSPLSYRLSINTGHVLEGVNISTRARSHSPPQIFLNSLDMSVVGTDTTMRSMTLRSTIKSSEPERAHENCSQSNQAPNTASGGPNVGCCLRRCAMRCSTPHPLSPICQMMKTGNEKLAGLLHSLPIPQQPWNP